MNIGKNTIRGLCLFFIFFMSISIGGCKSQKSNPSEGAATAEEFDIKVAKNIIDVYMKALLKDDIEGTKKLFSKELLKNTHETPNPELKVKGYSIEEISEIGKSGFFKAKIASTNLNTPVCTLDDCSLKVIKEGTEYKISEIKQTVDKEAFYENGTLRMRIKNNVNSNLLVDSGSFPKYTFSKDDKANMYKQKVPLDRYGALNFGYSGERVALCTYDKDSFIGIVKIDESQATQGGTSGHDAGQGGSAAGGTGGASGGSTGVGPREKPIGKEMSSIDLIKDAKVEFTVFSTGEKFLIAQYMKQGIGRCIRIYSVDSSEWIPVKFEEKYPYGKVEILFSSFDKDVINYEVVQKDNSTIDKSLADYVGRWQISLKNFKYKKL